MIMKKILPAIAIVSLAFSGTALAQGAIGGPSGSDSTNLQEEAKSYIPYSPVEPEYGVPVISNPGQVIVQPMADTNPAPGFMSGRYYYNTKSMPRGLTKLKGPVLDANGNHVYASEEVGSANFK
jgi:hypothetical protein